MSSIINQFTYNLQTRVLTIERDTGKTTIRVDNHTDLLGIIEDIEMIACEDSIGSFAECVGELDLLDVLANAEEKPSLEHVMQLMVERRRVDLLKSLELLGKYNNSKIDMKRICTEDAKKMMKTAVKNGDVDMMKYLHEHLEFPLDKKFFEYALFIKEPATSCACAKYLYQNDCPCDETIFDFVSVPNRVVVNYGALGKVNAWNTDTWD